jgi:hypothetical protein
VSALVATATNLQRKPDTVTDGVHTRHWTMVANAEAAEAALQSSGDDRVVSGRGLPVDLLLDDADRVVRLQLISSDRADPLTMDLRMGHFDEPVTIQAPDPSTVYTG